MKTITIRGIDDQASKKLKQAAKNEGKSVNQFVLAMMQERLGMKKKRFSSTFSDLDHLFGKWSEKEFKTIQNNIDKQRKIDADLW